MKYNIVAGEELKKKMLGILDNPIPFNEDMNKGTYSNKPFTEEFIKERSSVHGVSPVTYKEKLDLFLKMIYAIDIDDEINLYFGEDETCLANRKLLIDYFTGKVRKIILHIVDEYNAIEIKQFDL